MVQTFIKHNNEGPLVDFQDELSLDKFRQTELGDIGHLISIACKKLYYFRIWEHFLKKLAYSFVAVV